jgi:hypothetical protein
LALRDLGGTAISALTYLAGSAAVIFLIFYGIKYITSQGNPEKIKLARAGVINAIIGIIIITASNGIIHLGLSGSNILSSVLYGNLIDNSGATNSTTPAPVQINVPTVDTYLASYKSYWTQAFTLTTIPGYTYKKECRTSNLNYCLTAGNGPRIGNNPPLNSYGAMITCINAAPTEDDVDNCIDAASDADAAEASK